MKHRFPWAALPVLLALALLFAAFGVPRAAEYALERSCGHVVTVMEGTGN